MEQDCVAGLYESLGSSVGVEFSSEDVCVLFNKIFHLPSTKEDVHMAIKKIAGDDKGWSCIGERVLDVLIEMERERQKREELYWDLQLLNMGKLNTVYTMDTKHGISRQTMNRMQSHTKSTKQTRNRSDSEPVTSYGLNTYLSQRMQLTRKWDQERKGTYKSRLRRKARQHWARLVAEGVHSIIPSLWLGQGLRVRGQAWGYVSPSDLLLLVEVKYDAISHMLYTEMLQEHHGLTAWETLLPGQQDEEVERLWDLAEEAVKCGDLLRLAELPGAFRMYRSHEGVSLKSCREGSGSREKSWSAITILTELQTSCQQESNTLTALSKRLDREALRLLCLYIRLATLRAHREKVSYGALLATRQTWEKWPCVSSLCRKEQATVWLQDTDEDRNENEFSITVSPEQAVLQWLVLSQEQERKYLLRLLHGVSLEDLQGPGCQWPLREEHPQVHAALRDGCVRMLRQIHAALQTRSHIRTQSEQIAAQPHSQVPAGFSTPQWGAQTHSQVPAGFSTPQWGAQPHSQVPAGFSTPQWGAQPHSQVPAGVSTPQWGAQPHSQVPAGFSTPQWGACALLLMMQLMEHHEAQTSVVLPAILNMSAQHLQAVSENYETAVAEQRLCSLFQLLTSKNPLPADSLPSAGPTTDQNSNAKPQNNTVVGEASGEANPMQAPDMHNVCTGAAMEDVPYLEVLCMSDATTTTDGRTMDKGTLEDAQGQGSPRKTPQSYEKQESLITLAWSKPPEDDSDSDNEAEAVAGIAAKQVAEFSAKSVEGTGTDLNGTAGVLQFEEGPRLGSHMEEVDSSLCCFGGDPYTQFADEQKATDGDQQLDSETLMERPAVPEPPENRTEAPSDGDLQTNVLVVGTPEVEQTRHLASSPTTGVNEANIRSDFTSVGAHLGFMEGQVELEISPTQWDVKGPEAPYTEDNGYISRASVDYSESESRQESVSLIERERTMRSLVDMQRKVEQKQQRDRERQLLRVQERLSIVQNRKAQEDLQQDRIWQLTHNLPQEDKSQQKAVVKERLEQLRRERSSVMQSNRDRNTAGFKELLGPVAIHSMESDDGTAD